MPNDPLMEIVRALARHKARQDASAGIVDESIERYINDPSEETKEAVVASMEEVLSRPRGMLQNRSGFWSSNYDQPGGACIDQRTRPSKNSR